MPLVPPQPVSPMIAFARDLDVLLERYEGLVEPAAIGLVLETTVAAILGSYADSKDFDALRAHFQGLSKLAMAKAHLRGC